MSKVSFSESVRRYEQLRTRMHQHIQEEDAPALAIYLGMSLSNYYDKRRGERPLQYGDVSRLVERYGSQADRDDLQQFLRFRDELVSRMAASPIPLTAWVKIIGQKTTKALVYRGKQPEAWTPDEMAKVGAFLDDFGRF